MGRQDFSCDRTSFSKHFAMMGVSATGRMSFRAIAVECLGTGTMVVVLKLLETTAWPRGRLRMPGSKHKARYVIRASCLLGIVLAQGGANI